MAKIHLKDLNFSVFKNLDFVDYVYLFIISSRNLNKIDNRYDNRLLELTSISRMFQVMQRLSLTNH